MEVDPTQRVPSRGAEDDGLRVVTLGSAQARRRVLIFMGFRACIEPFELQRFALLANEWDAEITVVDAPGYGYGGGRLRPVERRALRRGEFTEVARRMVRVAQGHHLPLLRGSVAIVGYSMGASLACAAAADPGLLRVDRMILVEPVAMRRWNVARLLRTARSENAVLQQYLNDNVVVRDAVLPAERRDDTAPSCSRGDVAHLGFALSRGQLTRDLLHASRIQQFPVQIAHGVDSRLCTGHDIAKLATICRRAGMTICDVPLDGRHALWHSLPEVTAMARLTRKCW